MAFVDSLLEKGILNEAELSEVTSAVNDEQRLDEVLQEKGITEQQLLKLRSEYFGIPVADINTEEFSFDLLRDVPEESARHYRFVPIKMENEVMAIGIVDPEDIGARDAIQFIASKLNIPYKLYLVSLSTFQEIVSYYRGLSGEVEKALTELDTEIDVKKKGGGTRRGEELSDLSEEVSKTSGKEEITEEAPVTKIVAVVLRHAIEGGASDIHVEPTGDKVRVRFRVDGSLSTSLMLPIGVLDAIVARVKILTGTMRLDEKRKPQDGRFPAKIEGRKVDFRVSTFPTYYGEKVVMRVLDTEKEIKGFQELGMSEEHIEMVQKALAQPHGLVLLTGPTGSGKTTTLYTMLNSLDRDTKNVISLEDPVEYTVPGISQSQVRPEIGYTFASGLRSVLRQDPDIIMVGEIRDKETAQLAIQAALTGHLVFATLHTNSSAGVVPRLVDMGVDPYLIAPTLRLAIAQRLVKTLCPPGEKVPLSDSMRAMIEKDIQDLPEERKKPFQEGTHVYKAKSSPTCPTGVKGRIAAYEMFFVTDELEKVVLEDPVEETVYQALRESGMLSMKEDAILKAFNGVIPFEQVSELG